VALLEVRRRPALSNDVPMSEANEGDRPAPAPPEDGGVLGKLPRTRPQRSSPRRAAARKAAGAASVAASTPGSPAPSSAAAPPANGSAPRAATTTARRRPAQGAARRPKSPGRAAAGARTRSAPKREHVPPQGEHVPPQGFECEEDAARGAVRPPGGIELMASAVELMGELAKSGISTGERLVKDALARLPLS